MKIEDIELRERAIVVRRLADRIEAATCNHDYLDCSMDLQEQVWALDGLMVENHPKN